MKLVLLSLGIVAGIYISWEYPNLSEQIFYGFLEFANWMGGAITSMLGGGR
jgi:hypothetical protein